MEHGVPQPSINPWLIALEQSSVGGMMRTELFLYPVVEVVHILGFALLVGSILGFDLRLLGVTRNLPVAPFARHAVPLAMIGFFIAVPTGLLLFSTEATSIAVNPSFQIKLVCIGIGLANAAVFHLGPWRSMSRWGSLAGGYVPVMARIGAAVSLLAWIGAIAGGRLIAYF